MTNSTSRREFFGVSAAVLAAAAAPVERARGEARPAGAVAGSEHWTTKRVGTDNVKLFLWRKELRDPPTGSASRGSVLFVHGSSVSATPAFDLQIPGEPEASTMHGSVTTPGASTAKGTGDRTNGVR